MPGAWIWILVYVLAFALFQLLLYRYLQDDVGPSVEQAMPDHGDGDLSSSRAPARPVETEDGEGIRCPRCGAYNEREPAYTYCRECVQRLQ
ncbi:MAG: hypothetical protein V5A34_01910 [Halapricum sp.]|jgi:hypothetical protein